MTCKYWDSVALCITRHTYVVTDLFAVVILNGRYPQVTLIDSSLASGSSSHTTVVVPECLEQSPTTSLTRQPSLLIIMLIQFQSSFMCDFYKLLALLIQNCFTNC